MYIYMHMCIYMCVCISICIYRDIENQRHRDIETEIDRQTNR